MVKICPPVFAQITTDSPYRPTLEWAALHTPSLKILPSMGESRPYLIRDSLGPSDPTTHTASRSVQPFLHRYPQSVPTLERAAPSLKIAPSRGESEPHLIGLHGSLSLPESSTQTASWSVQPLLQDSLYCDRQIDTDRPTDYATWSVKIGRSYVRSTAMRPNNTLYTLLTPTELVAHSILTEISISPS